jgi:hypothetical protein
MGRAVGLMTGAAADYYQEWGLFQECGTRSACFGEGIYRLYIE